jgi:hypothetical protein
MRVNMAKSFSGPSRGIFCEKAYTLVGGYFLQENFCVSIRSLVYGDRGPAQTAVPPELSVVPYLFKERDRLGHRRAALLAAYAARRLYRQIKEVPPGFAFLPTSLGGYGLIPKEPRKAWSEGSLFSRALTSLHDCDVKTYRTMSTGIIIGDDDDKHAEYVRRNTRRYTAQTTLMRVEQVTPSFVPLAPILDKLRAIWSWAAIKKGLYSKNPTYRGSVRSTKSKIKALDSRGLPSRLRWSWQGAIQLTERVVEVHSLTTLNNPAGSFLLAMCGMDLKSLILKASSLNQLD